MELGLDIKTIVLLIGIGRVKTVSVGVIRLLIEVRAGIGRQIHGAPISTVASTSIMRAIVSSLVIIVHVGLRRTLRLFNEVLAE